MSLKIEAKIKIIGMSERSSNAPTPQKLSSGVEVYHHYQLDADYYCVHSNGKGYSTSSKLFGLWLFNSALW